MDAGRFLQGVMANFRTWWNTFFLWSICYGCMSNWLFAYPKDYFQGNTMGFKFYYPIFGLLHNSLESFFLL